MEHYFTSQDEWKRFRKGRVSASIAAAILGVDPQHTPFEGWLLATGQAEQEDTLPMRCGRALEPAAKRLAEEVGGLRLLGLPPYTVIQSDGRPWQIATPDDFLADRSAGFEAKAVGRGQAMNWGTGPDEIPYPALVQVMHSMAVTGLEAWYVGAIITSTDWRLYRIERDEELIEQIVAQEEEFYREYIATGQPPELDGSAAVRDWLRERYPAEAQPVAEANETERLAILRLKTLRVALDKAQAEYDQQVAVVQQMIGYRAGLAVGDEIVSWKRQKGAKYVDWQKVVKMAGVPDSVIAACTVQRPDVRVFRVPRSWAKGEDNGGA